MEPTQRVEIILKIANILNSSRWDEVDLILRNFDISTDSTRGNDLFGHIIGNLEEAADGNLFALYNHLFPTSNPSVLPCNVWQENKYHLFLSHLSEDKKYISDVKTHLLKYSIDSFVAHEDIIPTKEWMNEIKAALETCDSLAAFLSPNFHKSNWTDQEIGYCVKRGVLIIPIKMGLDPYGFISKYQALVDVNQDPSFLARSIFDILVSHELSSLKMASALVSQFETSPSYAEAKFNIALLEKVKIWNKQLLERIIIASENNVQIKESWGVRDRINSIINANN